MNTNFDNLKEKIEKFELLSEIYNDLGQNDYPTKKELEVANLKMKLLKKEMLLLNYLIDKDSTNS
jgi:hypothetical protein